MNIDEKKTFLTLIECPLCKRGDRGAQMSDYVRASKQMIIYVLCIYENKSIEVLSRASVATTM